MRDAPYSADPLSWEVKPGQRVRDLADLQQCEEALLYLDLNRDKMVAQIAEAEASPGKRDPGWRTRVGSALRWTARVRKAVNVRATAMRSERKPLEVRAVLKDAIADHKAAVLADEANFTDEGVAIDEEAAAISGEAEIEAFDRLVHVGCHTAADVQAKLDYFLNGSVGIRSELVECLLHEEYGAENMTSLLLVLLQSMVLAPAEGERAVTP